MAAPHDRPTAAELVDAVREFLESDVAPLLEGRTRFHARVAVNVLRIVERELAAGPAQRDAHETRLHALGVANDAALAAAIRSGELDGSMGAVVEAVRDSVLAKLDVADPGYTDR